MGRSAPVFNKETIKADDLGKCTIRGYRPALRERAAFLLRQWTDGRLDGRAIFPALIGDLGAIISTRDKKEEEEAGGNGEANF